jgi:two-component system sensor histidine kinase KdpD
MEHLRQPTKLMVTILGSPYSEYLINYTDILAKKLNTSWLALYVKTPRKLTAEEQLLLDKNIQLVEKLNAELIITESENIFESIALTAKQHQIKQLIIGRTLKQSIFSDPQRKILDIYPEVDIISINTGNKIENSKFQNQHSFLKWEFDKTKIPTTIYSLLFFTGINLLLIDVIDYRSLGMIFLMGITISSSLFKKYSALMGAALSTLIWNYIFIPPRYTLHTYSKEDWAMLITFL